MKTCIRCKIEKDENAFYTHSNKDGLRKECKVCTCVQRHTYYNINRDSIIKQKSKYEYSRKQTDLLFKFKKQTRNLVRNSLHAKGYNKSTKTHKLIGCSFEQLMYWLGPTPCENPVLDHVCPMAQARTEEEAIKLNHYMNLQWLTSEDNSHKSDNKTYAGEFLCQILLGRTWQS